jgi:hypothetical protein
MGMEVIKDDAQGKEGGQDEAEKLFGAQVPPGDKAQEEQEEEEEKKEGGSPVGHLDLGCEGNPQSVSTGDSDDGSLHLHPPER